ncbi:hypothetical protein MYP_2806 [Sporocytophaga myxococcoides]|uniref:Uncharacterized protein n=1 Tax=Sporocytophaga myxococcoides TaxID=153721 RepID=A0A098LGL1_9BACT|nr:hypothetical protein MYP_2806 [Sporocytophaga myxococcoides]
MTTIFMSFSEIGTFTSSASSIHDTSVGIVKRIKHDIKKERTIRKSIYMKQKE